MYLGMFTPFFYLLTYVVNHGMSSQLVSNLLAILNDASLFSRILHGILADNIGPLIMLFAVATSIGLLIFCLQAITTNVALIVFSVLNGFCLGAIVSLMLVAIAGVPKSPQNIGTYVGMAMGVFSIGALVGPPINGALVTKCNSFNQSLDMSGVFVTAWAMGMLIARHFKGKGLLGRYESHLLCMVGPMNSGRGKTQWPVIGYMKYLTSGGPCIRGVSTRFRTFVTVYAHFQT